jgi:DNA-directed RNA polymerase sigma subunit (sigma70/sigma32)
MAYKEKSTLPKNAKWRLNTLKIPKNDLSRSQWENLIDEWIFNERDRAILKRRLLDGLTFEQLAEEFNFSTQNIQRIVYKAQNKLFSKIK